MSSIPAYVQTFLPAQNLSVNDFLALSIPPCSSATAKLAHIKNYVSEESPNIHHFSNPTELLSPPPAVVTALEQHVKRGSITSVLCPHLPAAGGARYPLWIVEFWTKLLTARRVQESWKKAAHQLDVRLQTSPTNHLFQRAANALSCLPWTGDLRGYRNTIDTCHLSVYFTQEWLTDEHLLLMLELLEEDLSRTFQEQVFIENTHFTTLLTAAYHDQDL